MYNSVIFVVLYCSVIDLRSADCSVVLRCYVFKSSKWTSPTWDAAVTNIWCENMCKTKALNYIYSGTHLNICYCRDTKPFYDLPNFHKECTTAYKCAGNSSEICGGDFGGKYRITVSQIDPTTENVTITNTQATPVKSVSVRESTTANFISMMTSDTPHPAKVTQSFRYTTREVSSATSENVNPAISTVTTNPSTQEVTANGEWSLWNDWKFCEVNCVREDTTAGTQRRWRTCNGSNCTGDNMEEHACLRPGICKGMRPRKLLCKCPKRLINTKWHFLDGKNITDAEVKKIVLEDFNKNIKSEMSVDKKTVSKEVRKKNSSVNKRKSSQSIGGGCIVFLILPVVFLIAIDILNYCVHFQSRFGNKKRNRTDLTSDIKDSRDSSKPLQENVNITESYYASRCGNDFHPDEVKLETYLRRRDDNNEEDRDKWLQHM